jgi:hypothetical protein
MKITRFLTLLCLVSLVFVYLACQRDDYGSLPDPPVPAEKVQFSLSGRILDEQQLPVTGAVVKAGNLTASTDLNGNFQIKNVTLDANASFVKVEKVGYFTGSRTFKAIKGSSHFVSIQLIKKNDAGTFSSAAGGSITVPNGGTINFEAGSVINAQNNTPYTGTVTVSAFLLDPTAENFLEIMPGELRGIDENNKQVGLQSFGMMAVEMTGAAGERLQLAPSRSATMKFPIAAAQQASAPATIAFWSFNDTTGLWKQEGMATKQGNEYIGKASHFSFWNVDAPFALVDFKATLKDQDGNPAKRLKTIIKTADDENGPTAYSYSDTVGVIAGLIPAGKKLNLIIMGNCNDVIHTSEIGPFSATTDMGAISITIPANSKVTVTGEILECNGQPLANGFADIGILGRFERAPIVNGVLNYSFNRCGSSDTKASIRITDVVNNIIGGVKEVDVIANSASAGQIKVCDGDLTEYFQYDMDTVSRNFLPPADNVTLNKYDTSYVIYFGMADTSNIISFLFSDNGAGRISTQQLLVVVRKERFINVNALDIVITENGAAGEFVAGTFTGKMKKEDSPDPTEFPISGSFRLKRQE